MTSGVYPRTKKQIERLKKIGFQKGIYYGFGFKKGYKRSKKYNKIVSEKMKGNKNGSGYKHTTKWKDHQSKIMMGKNTWSRGRMWTSKKVMEFGYKVKQERNDSAYQKFVKEVKKIDNWNCRMANNNCRGRPIVHHILSWSKYPELRYKINNGITLCQFHHPRKRVEEQKLIPFFKKLVEVR